MKTLERYVFGSFLSSFMLAFLVLSFVLTIGLMVQIVGYMLDGVPSSLIGEFALVSFPETLQWTMPLALLVSSVLVFSRMSADSEIAAMRACGVNLLRVMKWPMALGLVCMLVSVFVNNEIVPRGHQVRRNLKNKVSVGTGIDLLEPGHVIDDFPKVKIYFGSKEGNWLHDLMVIDNSDKHVSRTITAAKALVTSEGRDIRLDLHQVTIDPLDKDHQSMARASRYSHTLKDALADTKYTKKGKDFNFREMLGKIAEMKGMVKKAEGVDERGRSVRKELKKGFCKLKVEFSKRFVFAAACLCFVLVGIPLGIKAQRKDSSVGMAISLAIAIGYYLIVMLMLSLQKSYAIHPEYLIFLPVVICMLIAAKIIPKNL